MLFRSVRVELFQAVRDMNQRNQSVHHTLVSHGQIIQKFRGFFPHLRQIVWRLCGKIVVVILTALPAGNVGFHCKDFILHILHRLIGRHGKYGVAAGPGSLSTASPLFVFLLLMIIVLVGALTLLPALALGPVAEQLGALA